MSFYSHFLDGTETGGHLLKVLAVCFKTKAINIVIPARLGTPRPFDVGHMAHEAWTGCHIILQKEL